MPADHGVDGVSRRTGEITHQDAILAHELVDERRLADVGTSHDRDAHLPIASPLSAHGRAGLNAAPGPFGKASHHDVQQVANPQAMLGRNRERRRHSQALEIRRRCRGPRVVHLVDGQHQRNTRAPHLPDDVLIGGNQSLPRIDQDDDDRRRLQLAKSPLGHRRLQRIRAGPEHPADVHQLEFGPEPLHRMAHHVASGPRHRGNDCPPAPRHAVEQRRLPDVRASHEHDAQVAAGLLGHGWGRLRIAAELLDSRKLPYLC